MGIQDILGTLGGQGGQQDAMDQIQRLFGGNGMQGIVSRLTDAGLGQQVQSWIGMGENQPVSGQQLQQAMDPSALRQLAQQTGMEPGQLCDQIAKVLPNLIDQVTPDGQLPAGGTASDVKSKVKDALKGMSNR
jgi:uncharacterized protein YidB (DUF937 family)